MGAKPILYDLQRDLVLQAKGFYLPRSTRTLWQVLREGGRIPTRIYAGHPLERPAPMQHREMDFGQLGAAFEFLTVVDRGTSILMETQTQPHYNAETALLAVAQLFIVSGLPHKLRFDNDTRFVGNWLSDGYSSPLMRFLWCLGVEPDLAEPGKPYHKPFAERSVRTLKYECLWLEPPEDWLDVARMLSLYRHFYNHERANQSLACGNHPPYGAFPTLPSLAPVPPVVDPDAWLSHYHRRIFRRRVERNGVISLDKQDYYVGYTYAGERIAVLLDAQQRLFRVLDRGEVIRTLEIRA